MWKRRDLKKTSSYRSASTKKNSELVASSWNDREPPAPPLPLSVSLCGLVANAEALHGRLDFATFVDIANSPQLPSSGRDKKTQWKHLERSTAFTLLNRKDQVLALAQVDASVEEITRILGATTDHSHAASMTGLYGDNFIAGSVAYVQRPRAFQEDQEYHHLAVKTTNFVHSRMLGKNEQWCFAEIMRRNADGNSFTLTQGSLSTQQAYSMPARSALKGTSQRVAQLRNVSAAYLVERQPGSHSLRVVYHAAFKVEPTKLEDAFHDVNETAVVSHKAVQVRLLRLAQGISHLPQLVRRRRFGTQIYADRSSFDVRNPRCTCCTQKLMSFFVPRTQCYLCGYYVCVTCASSEEMEIHNGQLTTITICSRCRMSVEGCDYGNMMSVHPGPECVIPDHPSNLPSPTEYLSSPTSSVCTAELSPSSSVSSDSSSSQLLADLLEQVSDNEAKTGRRRAALTVLAQLMLADQDKTQMQVEKNAQLLREANSSPQYLDLAKVALNVSRRPQDLAACEFASAAARPYPMIPALVEKNPAPSTKVEAPVYPIPLNEEDRLSAIERLQLYNFIDVPELNMICHLAAAEMNCPHSVVTLVERETVRLIATNAPEVWDLRSSNPREQTFCQHFVMQDKPLLVRHAEADVRFYHIAPVKLLSLRFYAGFPVSVTMKGSREKVVVGAMCCMDGKPHQMTRSQYWRLMKLAEAASEILEKLANEHIAA
uniref:FYVE-type domain-containing protein n=1 Tax=Peronospora matthiolae TaxID=2874970 RepID=A0AAV1TJ14_9STRA